MNRKFSIEDELQFVVAFGNSIMAEVCRYNVLCNLPLPETYAESIRFHGWHLSMKAGKRVTSSEVSRMS